MSTLSEYSLDFENRFYLGLLVLLPLLWWLSFRSMAALGRFRRVVAMGLRSLVLLLLIAALAEMQLVRTSNRLAVMYLIDNSLSVSSEQTDLVVRYVNEAIRRQRNNERQDAAGVIVFGRDAEIELPPLDDAQQIISIESQVDREHTNLAAAMKMAQAAFPHDAAKRIVILSDGNENLGDAMQQARGLTDDGIGIDVVPIRSEARGEVAVEKLAMPQDVRRGDPFDLRIVLNNTSRGGPKQGRVPGRLQLIRKAGGHEQVLSDQKMVLEPGKRVFTVPEKIEQPDFYTYEARFVPDDPRDDSMPQNNEASTFTHIRGSGQVLLIENGEDGSKGEFDFLVERLRAMNLEVAVQTSKPEELFTDLSQLQPYDTVILADVPREDFTDQQIQMLVRNTESMGSGLIMLGGANSFGAGGWNNTPLEEAMPVDFQIKNAKVVPIGALALLMHASELAQGNFWQKKIASEAIKALGNHDYCGLLHWSDMTGSDAWLWGRGLLQVGRNRNQMLARLDRMTPGDMPQFDPAMVMARNAFAVLPDAAVKHMIIISDGDPAPSSGSVVRSIKNAGIKISTVAVGVHGPPGHRELQRIATQTGGKYYVVTNPKALPRIYQREARRVSRPLVYEQKAGMQPQVRFPHEMIQGIASTLPPITGFVLTTVKENPLVEVSLVSPQPAGGINSTILASWTYGLGKTVAFTTDAGKRWATSWTGWENYDKLFSQIVRWSMRPVADTGKFTITTDVEDGKIKVVVTALNKNDEYLNFLELGSTVLGPDMKPRDLEMRQVAPGRYVGEIDGTDKGNYFVMLTPGPGSAPIRVGVNVPYSDEFRDRRTNESLLKTIATLVPKNGQPGAVIEPVQPTDEKHLVAQLLKTDTFRHNLAKATGTQDVWYLLVLIGGCMFFFDVFVRRVTFSFAWVPPLAAQVRDRIFGRETQPQVVQTMERLRSRKAEVGETIEQRRAAARFEPEPDAPSDLSSLEEAAPKEKGPERRPAREELAPGEKEADSYTSRLLKAKKKVWDDRDRPDA